MVEFLADNWLWIVVAGVFVWMHIGRGGCGGHHGHDEHQPQESANAESDNPHHHVG